MKAMATGKRYDMLNDYQGWRYSELFKVCIDGEDPKLVAAQNQLHAVDKLADALNMDRKMAHKMATVYTPTAKEILTLPRCNGIVLEMKVMLDGKPDHICHALCKEDAAASAATAWDMEFYEVRRQARFGVSRRSPMEFGG